MRREFDDLLRDVSRSFYLTLRFLPGRIRPQIGLAYLLARATDTIADTGAVSTELRLDTLRELRARILGQVEAPLALARLQENQSSNSERLLLERINEIVAMLADLSQADRQEVRRVLEIITSGQELDLTRFGNRGDRVVALQSDAELEDYTYRVAGCVGEFWTRICLLHLEPKPGVPSRTLVEQGISFGKGLQLVNILRDLAADLRNGRCYLPETALRARGLSPEDLLDPSKEQQLRPVYNAWLERASGHLETAWAYVLALPRSWVRTRIACAFPVLIGVKTISKLRKSAVLNPDIRVKVSRREVKRIVARTVFFYPIETVWRALPTRAAR